MPVSIPVCISIQISIIHYPYIYFLLYCSIILYIFVCVLLLLHVRYSCSVVLFGLRTTRLNKYIHTYIHTTTKIAYAADQLYTWSGKAWLNCGSSCFRLDKTTCCTSNEMPSRTSRSTATSITGVRSVT